MNNSNSSPALAVLAHEVTNPLSTHRRLEFANRMIYFSSYFPDFSIISRDASLKSCQLERDKEIGTALYRVSNRAFASSMYVKDFVEAKKIDVLFSDTNDDGYASMYAKLSNKKLINILFLQGFPSHLELLSLRRRLNLEIKRSNYEYFYAFRDSVAFKFYDVIFCVSKSLATYAKTLMPEKRAADIYYIPHSLDYIKRMPSKSEVLAEDMVNRILSDGKFGSDIFLLCFVGGLTENKRPDIAIKALARIVNEGRNAVLLMLGNGFLKPQLQQLSVQLKVANRVIFLGSLPQYDSIALVSKCNALIFPSLSEGFSMAIAEALAVGCPVISYAHETAKEIAYGGGLMLVDSLNPNLFADKVIQLMNKESLRQNIITAGKETISSYINFSQNDRFKLMASSIQEVYAKHQKLVK